MVSKRQYRWTLRGLIVAIIVGAATLADFSGFRLPTDLNLYLLIAETVAAVSLVLVLLFGEDFYGRFLSNPTSL